MTRRISFLKLLEQSAHTINFQVVSLAQNSCAPGGLGVGCRYDTTALPHWRHAPPRRRGHRSARVRSPLLRGRIRLEQARDAEGRRDEDRVGEPAYLGVSGCA